MRKCEKGVSWKPSVKAFDLNCTENLHRLEKQLRDGAYQNGKPRPIMLTYPKKREALSIPFRDRVYQRSINDNVLYPKATRSFIHDNWACQKGKGTDAARQRVKAMLWKALCRWGMDFYVIQTDFQGYYKNLSHDVVNAKFAKVLEHDELEAVVNVLDSQYKGDTGYNPGSQMVQIAGISVPDEYDHFAKEDLHIEFYARYMDDTRSFVHRLDEAERHLAGMTAKAAQYGMIMHPDKTRITPISEGFMWLGFRYWVKDMHIIMSVNSDTVKAWRRKMYRLVKLEKQGLAMPGKSAEFLHSIISHASHGNSGRLIARLEALHEKLWEEL